MLFYFGCLVNIQIYQCIEELPEPTRKFTEEQKYICKRMSTKYPILPINNKQSFKLFNRLVMRGYSDDTTFMRMAIKWCELVGHKDYTNILPTGPAYLRRHFKKWKKGQRAKEQLKLAKQKVNEIKELFENSETKFLAALASIENNVFGVGHRESLVEITPTVQKNPPAASSRAVIHVDTELAETEAQPILPETAAAAAPVQAPTPTRKKSHRSGRGLDKSTIRNPRTCQICKKFGKIRQSKTCSGRVHQSKCPLFNG